MDLSKTPEAAKREAAAMDDGERRTLLARIDELDRHGQRWKRERDEAESDLTRVRRERDRLKKCIADMEDDCACLPEDRSVTETVTRLRRGRDEAEAVIAAAGGVRRGYFDCAGTAPVFRSSADGAFVKWADLHAALSSAPELVAVDGEVCHDRNEEPVVIASLPGAVEDYPEEVRVYVVAERGEGESDGR